MPRTGSTGRRWTSACWSPSAGTGLTSRWSPPARSPTSGSTWRRHSPAHRVRVVNRRGRPMPVLASAVEPDSPAFTENREAMLARLSELDDALDKARAGGGESYTKRHHDRGKMLARERIEVLVDRDSPLLELMPVAAFGSDFPVGASVVTAIGIIENTPCMIIANDPTVRGGAVNPYTLKKTQRAGEIALANRLPMVNLVESGGADLPTQAEIFIPGGRVFRDLTRL